MAQRSLCRAWLTLLALKESITPGGIDRFVYFVAPIILVIPAFTAFAFIPFGPEVSVFLATGHRCR